MSTQTKKLKQYQRQLNIHTRKQITNINNYRRKKKQEIAPEYYIFSLKCDIN